MEKFFVSSPVLRAKKALGVETDTALAKALGVAQSVIGGYNRRNTVPLEQCIKIAERTGVSLDWLILGKGEMKGGSAAPERKKSVMEEVWAALEENRSPFPDVAFVPLFDAEVGAGNGIEVYGENIIQLIPFSQSWLAAEGLYIRDLACLPVNGDSMIPSLTSGDIVLVNHAKRNGDGVFVVRMGNALRVKRLQWLANGDLRISSDNPIYQTEQITPAELAGDFDILGACHTRISRVG